MASHYPPVKNDSAGYTFYLSLVSQANAKIFQANPTLATGDAKIAIDDGAPANLATLPVVDADFTKRVKVVLSQAETNGDNLTIILSDAAGSEWCDVTINLQTVPVRFDGLATPTNITAGTITTVTNLTNAPTNGDLTATMKTSVTTAATAATPTAAAVTGAVGSVTGNVGGNVTGSVGSIASGGITAASIATGAIDADALATDAVAEIADGILDRDMATGADSGSSTVRTMRQALRFLRNKWSISGTTLTVTKEDDATTSWTATVTTDAAADPITASDPAGP